METPNLDNENSKRYWKACTKIHYRAEEVTNEKVRTLTGGSMRDITPVVKKFKEGLKRQQEFEKAELPPQLEETTERLARTLAVNVWEDATELASAETLELQSEIEELKKKLDQSTESAQEEVKELKKELAKLEITNDDQKTHNRSMSDNLDSCIAKIEEVNENNQRLQLKIAGYEGRLIEQEKTIEKLGADLQEEREKTVSQREERAILENDCEEKDKEIFTLKKSLKTALENLRVSKRFSEELENSIGTITSERNELKNKLEKLKPLSKNKNLSTIKIHGGIQRVRGLRMPKKQVTHKL